LEFLKFQLDDYFCKLGRGDGKNMEESDINDKYETVNSAFAPSADRSSSEGINQ